MEASSDSIISSAIDPEHFVREQQAEESESSEAEDEEAAASGESVELEEYEDSELEVVELNEYTTNYAANCMTCICIISAIVACAATIMTFGFVVRQVKGKLAALEANENLITRRECFHARLAESKLYKMNSVLPFTLVVYQEGRGFKADTGTFLPPIRGTYVFLLAIGAKKPRQYWNHGLDPSLMITNHILCTLFSGYHIGPQSATCVVVVGLNLEMNVRVVSSRIGTYSAPATTFSGFLLSAYEPVEKVQ